MEIVSRGNKRRLSGISPRKPVLHTSIHKGCPRNVQRHDMFRFMRWNLYFTAMYRLPIERYLPNRLRFIGIAVDLSYELFMYLTLLHIDILYIFTIYLNRDKGDLGLIVSGIIQIVIYTWSLIVKVYFKRIQPKRLEKLMKYLNDECRMHSGAGFTYVTMEETAALSNNWTTIFLLCGYVAVVFWLFVPFFNQDRSLPLACWYPIDYKTPVVYEITFLLQTIGQLQVAGAFGSTSSFFLLVSVLFCGQFDILNCSLKNILATTYLHLRKSKANLRRLREKQQIADSEVNQYYSAKEHITDLDCIPHLLDVSAPKPKNFYAAFKMAFVPCLMHHRYILCGLGEFDKLYSFIWLLKIVEVTMLICLVAFDFVKSTAANSFLRMLLLSQYLLMVLWDMFVICYSSEIIFMYSQRCGEALQRSPWYLHSREIKKDILFFLLNAQRPYQFTGGKLYKLNLQQFRSILTTSFSILTILQKMDQRETQPK